MNIKKLAVDAAIQASAPTPPDTATDAGREWKVVAWYDNRFDFDNIVFGPDKPEGEGEWIALVLASDLDVVQKKLEGSRYLLKLANEVIAARDAKLDAVTAERDEAIESEKEESFIREKLARLLARSIIVLRGPEPKLTRWGYQDLPERVQELKDALAAKEQECERLREDAERWRRWLPWLRGLNRKPFGLAKEIHEIDAVFATGGRHD